MAKYLVFILFIIFTVYAPRPPLVLIDISVMSVFAGTCPPLCIGSVSELYGPVIPEFIYIIPPDGILLTFNTPEPATMEPRHRNVLVPFARLTTLLFVTTDAVINAEFSAGIGTNVLDNISVLFTVPTDDNIFAPDVVELYTTFVYIFVPVVSLMPAAPRLIIRDPVPTPASGATTENTAQ